MASPADPSHPLTPPAEQTQSSQNQNQSQSQTQPTPPSNNPNARADILLSEPLTSLDDNGTSKRPRDHRLIHLLLASHGISAYQERVPLQLMDFAYRYTSNVLSDAVHIQAEGYDHAEGAAATSKGRGAKNQNKGSEEGDISLQSLRFSIGSRLGYQFSGSLPKEFLKQLADERNRISLAAHMREGDRSGAMVGGIKLPHERFCLTGTAWGLKDEWESEGEESIDENGINGNKTANGDHMQLDGTTDQTEAEDGADEEGVGNMEDIFGNDGGDGGDEEMQDL